MKFPISAGFELRILRGRHRFELRLLDKQVAARSHCRLPPLHRHQHAPLPLLPPQLAQHSQLRRQSKRHLLPDNGLGTMFNLSSTLVENNLILLFLP